MANLPTTTKRRRRDYHPLETLFDWDDFFPGFFSKPMVSSLTETVPALDFTETDSAYKVAMELPGVTAENVKVSLDENRVLSISGEKKREEEHKEGNRYHCERSYGSFSRSLQLPEGVDTENINASFTDGVLKVTLNKREPKAAKTISIDVNGS